jgi:hypothetical protein
MRKVIFGWFIIGVGAALWTYGYLAPSSAPFVDWRSFSPWWIADYLPSKEAELGVLLMCVGMIPLYWPGSDRPKS